MNGTRHVAQLNIGRVRYGLDDPRIAGFVDNLARVNALAERSPGYVWRLQDDSGNATAFRMIADPHMMVNLSVWESVETLERFVWNTVHRRFYEQRGDWFEPLAEPHFVMWLVPPGHRPTLEEAAGKLAHLRAHGSSETAFGWEWLPELTRRREASGA